MAHVHIDKITITLPLKSGREVAEPLLVESLSATKDGPKVLRQQKSTLQGVIDWLSSVNNTQRRTTTTNTTWLDLLASKTPMVIGTKPPMTAVVIFHAWPADHRWIDARNGNREVILPPVAVGGTWNTSTHKLTWSGVALLPGGIPPLFVKDMNIVSWPMGNVYEDGHVCWGENSMADITVPAQIHTMFHRFFDTPFNADLRRSGWRVVDGKLTLDADIPTIPFNSWVHM